MRCTLRNGVAKLVNSDHEALIAAAIGPSVLGRSPMLQSMARGVAAAIRRKEKPFEIHRQLSAFCTEFNRTSFVTIFSKLLSAKYELIEYVPDQVEPKVVETLVAPSESRLVRKAAAFDGPMEDCVFHAGAEGVGYYRDVGLRTLPPANVSEHTWRLASRHARSWGAGGVPELRQPARRHRLKQERLLSAVAHISDERNLQILAYGDHKLKLPDGEELIVGAAHLRVCRAELYRSYCVQCEELGETPLDQKSFNDAAAALANGKTAREGALDPVAVATARNFERQRTYVREVGDSFPSMSGRCKSLVEMIDLVENVMLHTMGKFMTSADTEVVEHDITWAIADPSPRRPDPSRPKPRAQSHTKRDPQLAKIQQLRLELTELLADIATAAKAAAAPAAVDAKLAAQIAEWRQLVEYAWARIKHGVAHKVRCIHESKTPRTLIARLKPGQAGAITDWKAKWLVEVFREPQSEFFGKTGIPLLGVMFYVATDSGEIDTFYYDPVMKADGREDGVASFAGFKLCVDKFKEEHSQVTELDWVRTDGAGCFSGVEFVVGLALMDKDSGLPVNEAHIGEAGNNKNSQDAHFAKLGRAAARLVDSGLFDIDSELRLAQAVAKVGLKNTHALLYTVDRTFKLQLQPIDDLKLMSQRIFEKDANGKTISIRLHQQSFLGEGRAIDMADLLIDEEHTSMPTATEQPLGDVTANAGSSKAKPRARGRDKIGLRRLVAQTTTKGLSLDPAAMQQRRDDRAARKVAERAALAAAIKARRLETGGMLYCCYQTNGCATCPYKTSMPHRLAQHLAAGKHDGANGADGAREARIALAARDALEGRATASAAMRPLAAAEVVDATGFTVTLLSSRVVPLPPQPAGWACMQRLPVTMPSSAAYEFAAWAAKLPDGKQLKNKEAALEMARVGTPAFCAAWPGDPYTQKTKTADGKPFFARMSLIEPPALKALLTKGAAYCLAQATKARAREAKAAAKAAAAVRAAAGGEAQTQRGGQQRAGQQPQQQATGARQRAPRAHTTGDLIDATGVTLASPIATLNPKAVFGIGAPALQMIAYAWLTCADLLAVAKLNEVQRAKAIADGRTSIKAAEAARVAAAADAPKARALPGAPVIGTLAASLRKALEPEPTTEDAQDAGREGRQQEGEQEQQQQQQQQQQGGGAAAAAAAAGAVAAGAAASSDAEMEDAESDDEDADDDLGSDADALDVMQAYLQELEDAEEDADDAMEE